MNVKLLPDNFIFLFRRYKFYFQRLFGVKLRLIHLDELKMFVDFQTPGISSALYIYKTREIDMIRLIKENIPQYGDIIDCGSNMGFYPILESKYIQSTQRVVCIEPDSRNFSLLRLNNQFIESNSLLLKCAVSDYDKQATLDVGSASNLNKIVPHSSNSQLESVNCFSIDSLVSAHSLSPSFLRMDVEGHEVEVLRGMRSTLRNAKPGFILFFEVHPNEYNETHSLQNELLWLYDNGFKTKYLVSAGAPHPQPFRDLDLNPLYTIDTDNFTRGVYSDVSPQSSIALTSIAPKVVRYIMLIKSI